MAKNITEKDIINNIKDLMSFLGIIVDENTKETPQRMVKALQEMCCGINKEKEIKDILSVTFPTKYTGMISQGAINIHSLCAHHLLPVIYDVFIGYIPKKRVIGFGKISKATALLGARPQNQEDFTQDIADTFKNNLKPYGIGVLVIGRHSCMFCRSNGVNHQNAFNITSAVRGSFRKNNATKEEFLNNINLSRGKQNI
ncbi:GTP cyclohydrolase I [Candidatus Wolfebacteria bacterium]|nr:GTP cyclohydrolase I [Candidatus Wolfebacteria bacterium]